MTLITRLRASLHNIDGWKNTEIIQIESTLSGIMLDKITTFKKNKR